MSVIKMCNSMLHIITGLNTGGAERTLYNLLQGGMAGRFDTHVISLMDDGTIGPRIRALGVPVTALGMRRGVPSISAIKKLRRVVREQQPDLIQGWMYHGNLAACMARFFTTNNSALVWNVRHSIYNIAEEKPMSRQVIRANRFLSKLPDSLLYNSHVSRRQHEKLGFFSLSGQVIPNGIDVQVYARCQNSHAKIRSELNIPTDALVVGHVARLHPMKAHPLLLQVAVRLVRRFPGLHFILCGRGVSFDNENLKQLVPAEIRPYFHLLGERSDIPDLMNAMDVFSSSSSYGEGFPNVLGEAMACELPCVATDVGDSKVIVSDFGVVVSPHDEAAFADGIERLLRMPSDERRKLGVHARKHITDNFSLESIVKWYCELYGNLLKNKKTGDQISDLKFCIHLRGKQMKKG